MMHRYPTGMRALRLGALVLAGLLLALLAACSSAPRQPDPTPLQPVPPILHVAKAWSAHIGAVAPNLRIAVAGSRVVVASNDGQVRCLRADDGATLWRSQVAGGVSAGVGSDGSFSAVVNQDNQVVALGPQGQVLWRYRLPTSVLTAPAVFGGMIIVQGADEHLWAFNAATGALLWDDAFEPPSLLLQRGSGIVRVGDALVLGDASGHLRALRLRDGTSLWDSMLVQPRGFTDVERLVAITGAPAVAQSTVCARAYQTGLGCLSLADGHLLWSAQANGYTGVSQDGKLLVATQADGVVQSYAVADGKPGWHNDQLKWRDLSAPLLLGHTVAVGDLHGYVSFLDAGSGRIIGRVSTDGSAIASPLALAGKTLVVLTRDGAVYGFVPR